MRISVTLRRFEMGFIAFGFVCGVVLSIAGTSVIDSPFKFMCLLVAMFVSGAFLGGFK